MNKVFKKIWSKSQGCVVVVSENANSEGKKSSTTTSNQVSSLDNSGSFDVNKVLRVSALPFVLISTSLIVTNAYADACYIRSSTTSNSAFTTSKNSNNHLATGTALCFDGTTGTDKTTLTLNKDGATYTTIRNVAGEASDSAINLNANANNAANVAQVKHVLDKANAAQLKAETSLQYTSDTNIRLGKTSTSGVVSITNLQAGALSDTSTDAVNGKQLYEVKTTAEAAKTITDKAVKYDVKDGTTVNLTKSGDTYTTISNVAGTKDTITSENAKNAANVEQVKHVLDKADAALGSVNVNDETYYDAKSKDIKNVKGSVLDVSALEDGATEAQQEAYNGLSNNAANVEQVRHALSKANAAQLKADAALGSEIVASVKHYNANNLYIKNVAGETSDITVATNANNAANVGQVKHVLDKANAALGSVTVGDETFYDAKSKKIKNLEGSISDISTLEDGATEAQQEAYNGLSNNAANVEQVRHALSKANAAQLKADAALGSEIVAGVKHYNANNLYIKNVAGETSDITVATNAKNAANVGQVNFALTQAKSYAEDLIEHAQLVISGVNLGNATGTNSISIGSGSEVNGASSSALGDHNNVSGNNSLAVGSSNTVVGNSSTVVGDSNTVIGDGSGAFGDPNYVRGLGSYARGNNNSVIGNNSLALGNGNSIIASNSFAIGNNAIVIADNAIAIGNNSKATSENTISVGNETLKRKIVNVEDGSALNDAVNLGQLNKVSNSALKLNEATGAYTANSKKLQHLLDGTENTDAATYGQVKAIESSLATVTSSANNSVQYDNGKTSVTLVPGSSPVTIKNVKAGELATDAVNFGQLDGLNQVALKLNSAKDAYSTEGKKLQNLMDGSLDNDAATVKQVNTVKATSDNSVQYDSGKTSVTLAPTNSPVTIKNVKAGELATDAVNLGQLDKLSEKTLQLTANGNAYNADSKKIRNLKDGTLDTDAATYGQVKAVESSLATVTSSANNSVQYDSGKTSVTLAPGSSPVTIKNVKAGELATDAVNFGQLEGLNQVALKLNSAKDAYSAEGKKLQNLMDGILDNDAATVKQVNAVDAALTTSQADIATLKGFFTGNTGSNSLSIGTNNYAAGKNSIAIGSGNDVFKDAKNAIAFGLNNTVLSEGSVSIGRANTVGNTANNSVTLGIKNTVSAENAIAIGRQSNVSAKNSLAIGNKAEASARNSVALGAGSVASEANTVSVGSSTNTRRITNLADGLNLGDAINFGQYNHANTNIANWIGGGALFNSASNSFTAPTFTIRGQSYSDVGSAFVGVDDALSSLSADLTREIAAAKVFATSEAIAKADAAKSEANQYTDTAKQEANQYTDLAKAEANQYTDTAKQQANQYTDLAKESANAYTDAAKQDAITTAASNTDSEILKVKTEMELRQQGVSVGGDLASQATGPNSLALGNGSIASGSQAMALGDQSIASGNQSISIGTKNNVSGNNSGALGDPNTVSGNNSYVVGNDNTITTDDTFVLGSNVTTSAKNSVVLGNKSETTRENTVSVGSAAEQRQIINVAAGTQDTDAANYGQVKDVQSKVSNLESSFNDYAYKVDRRFQEIDKRFDRQGAMSAAMMQMATSTSGLQGQNRIGVGAGFQGSEAAVAVGYQRIINPNTSFSLGGAFTEDEASGGAGIGFSW